MSFVATQPQFVNSFAQNLAGVGSTLSAATSSAAGPTIGVVPAAADEVSAAITGLFRQVGAEFQALGAKAASFHDSFVALLGNGAGQYVAAEASNAAQTMASGLFAPGAFAGALQGFESFAAQVGEPYQALFANTGANVQSLISVVNANGFPLLHQVGLNMQKYATTGVTGFASLLDNLPTTLANLPANAEAALSGFNPSAFLNWAGHNFEGYGQTIQTSFNNAAHSFYTQLEGFPAYLDAAYHSLQSGNFVGALNDVSTGVVGLFFNGFETTVTGTAPGGLNFLSIGINGAAGDLLPILTIPGQMAQSLTYLMPPGSILAQMAQNATNVISAVTNTQIDAALGLSFVLQPTPGFAVNLANTLGVLPAMGLQLAGAPVATFEAIQSSMATFEGALAAGNAPAALATVLNSPAVALNAFLNGHDTFALDAILGQPGDLQQIVTTVQLPMDGILVPQGTYPGTSTIITPTNPPQPLPPFQVGGTPLGGLMPALLGWLPGQLAPLIA